MGSVTMYLSTTVRNPNEVEYDFAINASVGSNGNIYIPPITLTSIRENAETGKTEMNE